MYVSIKVFNYLIKLNSIFLLQTNLLQLDVHAFQEASLCFLGEMGVLMLAFSKS